MIFGGLDLSVRGTGICALGPGLLDTARVGQEIDTKNPALDIDKELVTRNLDISREVIRWLQSKGVRDVAVENYAYGAFKKKKKGKSGNEIATISSSVTVLAELGGVIKRDLWIKMTLIARRFSPQTCRKLVLGYGRMKKEDVIKGLRERGMQFKSGDEADAFVVAASRYCEVNEVGHEQFWDERHWE